MDSTDSSSSDEDHHPRATSSSTTTSEENRIFKKLNEKIKLENIKLISIKRESPIRTIVTCQTGDSNLFNVISTIISGRISLTVTSLDSPDSPPPFVQRANEIAADCQSISLLLEYIDKDILVLLESALVVDDIAEEEEVMSNSSAVSSGTTASRRSSRSTTPTMSDRAE